MRHSFPSRRHRQNPLASLAAAWLSASCLLASMRQRLQRGRRSLSDRCKLWLLLFGIAAGVFVGCEEHPSAKFGDSEPEAVGDSKADLQAQKLLRRAAAALESHHVITAKIRQTIDLYGQHIVGDGAYEQMRIPANEDAEVQILSRIKLRLQVREQTATWEQLCDGKLLWTYRRLPDAQKDSKRKGAKRGYSNRLKWVDLAKVKAALGNRPPEHLGFGAWGIGGLSRMLSSLADAFEFYRVCEAEISGVAVWAIDGRWKPYILRRALPRQKEAIDAGTADLSQLPRRMPHIVSVYLRMSDLFPFRIVYQRRSAGTGELTDVVNLELYQETFYPPNKSLERERFVSRWKKYPRGDDTSRFLSSYRH